MLKTGLCLCGRLELYICSGLKLPFASWFFSDIIGAYNHGRWRCQHEIIIISLKTWPQFVATSDWWSSLKSCVSGGWRLSFWWSLEDVFSNLGLAFRRRSERDSRFHLSPWSFRAFRCWSWSLEVEGIFEAGETEIMENHIWKKTSSYSVLHNSIYFQFPFFFNQCTINALGNKYIGYLIYLLFTFFHFPSSTSSC